MKIRHWSLLNRSGMHHLALACAEGERRLGHDALVVDASEAGPWTDPRHLDADVLCIHSRLPKTVPGFIRDVLGREPRIVFFSHGIPEHLIEQSVTAFANPDALMPVDTWGITRYWLTRADAFVVFNFRQQAIYQSMVPKGRVIDCVPLGVDTAFWANGPADAEHLPGKPAVWMSENQHRIKWALDVLVAWPWVAQQCPDIHLHAHTIPFELHRFFVDLANTNGASNFATITANYYSHEHLRRLWKGCDYLLATTRYGDNTCLTMQAEAAGLTTISYPGNQYASYWVAEGDQRVIADQLAGIFSGCIPPRPEKVPVPSLEDMARHTVAIYERIH